MVGGLFDMALSLLFLIDQIHLLCSPQFSIIMTAYIAHPLSVFLSVHLCLCQYFLFVCLYICMYVCMCPICANARRNTYMALCAA